MSDMKRGRGRILKGNWEWFKINEGNKLKMKLYFPRSEQMILR